MTSSAFCHLDKKPMKKEDKGKGGVAYEAMEGRGMEKPSEVIFNSLANFLLQSYLKTRLMNS